MKVEITNKQLDKLKKHVQNLIDGELHNLREESQDWVRLIELFRI